MILADFERNKLEIEILQFDSGLIKILNAQFRQPFVEQRNQLCNEEISSHKELKSKRNFMKES